jgi:hypothetical protein
LLDVQLGVQQGVIDGVVEYLSKRVGGDLYEEEEFDVNGVPGLLLSARVQVQKTIAKIVTVTEARCVFFLI